MGPVHRSRLAILAAAALLAGGCADADAPTSLMPESSVAAAHGDAAPASDRHFKAHLTAAQEVADVESVAQGQALFRLSEDGTELTFKLIVANLDDLFMAHIHRGAAGANGPIVVWLHQHEPPAQDPIEGRFSGVLATGVITVGDLTGPLAGSASLDALIAEIRAGNTYVNVHTTANPGGEIRGQIE